MNLITNIQDIEKRAAEQEEENWRFRGVLKACDLEAHELDAIVHRLNAAVSTEIDKQELYSLRQPGGDVRP